MCVALCCVAMRFVVLCRVALRSIVRCMTDAATTRCPPVVCGVGAAPWLGRGGAGEGVAEGQRVCEDAAQPGHDPGAALPAGQGGARAACAGVCHDASQRPAVARVAFPLQPRNQHSCEILCCEIHDHPWLVDVFQLAIFFLFLPLLGRAVLEMRMGWEPQAITSCGWSAGHRLTSIASPSLTVRTSGSGGPL